MHTCCTGFSKPFGLINLCLSGESADEVFGGYSWFHDPKAINAATFPWLAATGNTYDGTQVLDADFGAVESSEFQADSSLRRLPRPRSRRARTPLSGACERSAIFI